MSFDIYPATITLDERDDFERAIVERAFKDIAERQDSNYWSLRLPDGESVFATVSIDVQPRISSFSVDRPPSFEVFPTFWEAMFDVLRQTRTVLIWPGGLPPIASPIPRSCPICQPI